MFTWLTQFNLAAVVLTAASGGCGPPLGKPTRFTLSSKYRFQLPSRASACGLPLGYYYNSIGSGLGPAPVVLQYYIGPRLVQ